MEFQFHKIKVLKRNFELEQFDVKKIVRSIAHANRAEPIEKRIDDETFRNIIELVVFSCEKNCQARECLTISTNQIRKYVESSLKMFASYEIMKCYMIYPYRNLEGNNEDF